MKKKPFRLQTIHGFMAGLLTLINLAYFSLLFQIVAQFLTNRPLISLVFWPEWKRFLFWGLICALSLWLTARMIKRGLSYGLRLEMESRDNLKQRKRFMAQSGLRLITLFLISSVLAFQFIKYSSLRAERQKVFLAREKKRLALLVPENIWLVLSQEGEGMGMDVVIPGTFPGRYRLRLQVMAAGTVIESLKKISEQVFLSSQEQRFHYYISFDELARAYYRERLAYRFNVNRETVVPELIRIDAWLKLLGTTHYSAKHIQRFDLPEVQQTQIALFSFLCDKRSCRVVQKNKESPR